ncbi:MAG: hypothetical protein Q7S74_01280 [Nanoarchaeota archaeon]|nr:hypothetical protein [Nanoarchaeota archaeon]
MKIKRFPKPSLSPQQADGVLRSASGRKSLIVNTREKAVDFSRFSPNQDNPKGLVISDDVAKLQGIKSNLTIKEFFSLFPLTLKGLCKNPLIVIPTVIFWIFLEILSRFSVFMNHRISNTIAITSWAILYVLISLFVMSFILVGIIGIAKKSMKEKSGLKDFIMYSKKFGLKNFLVMLIIVIISIISWAMAHYGALFIGRALSLSINTATTLFKALYVAGLVGIVIFISFTSFYLVIFDLKIYESFRRSMKLVKREYLYALAISLALYFIHYLLNNIPLVVGDIIEYVVIVPLFVLFVTRFIIVEENIESFEKPSKNFQNSLRRTLKEEGNLDYSKSSIRK